MSRARGTLRRLDQRTEPLDALAGAGHEKAVMHLQSRVATRDDLAFATNYADDEGTNFDQAEFAQRPAGHRRAGR